MFHMYNSQTIHNKTRMFSDLQSNNRPHRVSESEEDQLPARHTDRVYWYEGSSDCCHEYNTAEQHSVGYMVPNRTTHFSTRYTGYYISICSTYIWCVLCFYEQLTDERLLV